MKGSWTPMGFDLVLEERECVDEEDDDGESNS